MTKIIPLKQTKRSSDPECSMLVDDEDYDWLSTYTFHAHQTSKRRTSKREIYARCFNNGDRFYAHAKILECEPGFVPHHINGNGLDNRRCNLIAVPGWLNIVLRGPTRGRRFKGVFKTRNGKYAAQLTIRGKTTYLGTFNTEEEAAWAYDCAALAALPEFAHLLWLNFPKGVEAPPLVPQIEGNSETEKM